MKQLGDTCPVCSMKADTEIAPVEHDKMYFYFCSEPCRKTFAARPNLYHILFADEKKIILKQRIMNLTEPLGKAGEELLTPYLMAMMGVKEVLVVGDKFHVVYDLLQVTEKQIETILLEVGVTLGGNWLENFRRGWVQDCEDNELDHLAAPPSPHYTHAPK